MSKPICPVCEETGFNDWHSVVNHLAEKHDWNRGECVCGESFWVDRGSRGDRHTLVDHLADLKDAVLHVALERIGKRRRRLDEWVISSGAIMSGMIGVGSFASGTLLSVQSGTVFSTGTISLASGQLGTWGNVSSGCVFGNIRIWSGSSPQSGQI